MKKLIAFVICSVLVLAVIPVMVAGAQPVPVKVPEAENLPLWFRHWYVEGDPDTTLEFDAFDGLAAHMTLHWQGYGDLDACPEFSNGNLAGFSGYITYVGGAARTADLLQGTITISTGGDRDRLYVLIGGGSVQDPTHPFYTDYQVRGWQFVFVTDEEAQPLDMHLFDDFFGADEEPEDVPGNVPEIGAGIDDFFGDTADFDINELADLEMLAASGAGAWGGYLCFDIGGLFRGDYYDTDYDPYTDLPVTETVVFRGRLADPVKISDTVYSFTVRDVDTDDEPGGQWTDEYGETYVYIESLFPEGSTALLTLPGTPEDQIPEAVTMEFYGCYPEASISDFVTLTREDGWGFFEMPENDMP